MFTRGFYPCFRSIGKSLHQNGREKAKETQHAGEKTRRPSGMERSVQFRHSPPHSPQNSSASSNEALLRERKEKIDRKSRPWIDVKRRSG